jgi:light-regulated signal transduction histidine kinase (bacteriophytochrome)
MCGAERFRTLVDELADGVLVLSPDGVCCFANSAARMLVGGEDRDPVGRCLSHDFAAKDITELALPRADCRDAVAQVRAWNVEWDGEPARLVWLRDVTERRRLLRTLESEAEKLVRARAELQDLAYVASHDFQEPLRMVSSYVELLARRYEGQLDADADRFIRYAVDGAARMKGMIDDLLRYSRVASGRFEWAPVPLGEVFEEVATALGGTIREAGARVVAGELPTIAGCRSQLFQLLQSLIDNALKYRGESAPEIDVHAACDGERCTVSVTDNGIGFPIDQAERIFRPFQRLHERGRYPGSGIGLAIAKRIVERHDGAIWAESELGAGSTFHFRLPLARDVELRE